MFIGCIITGAETALANVDIDDHCNDNPYNTDNNSACRHLQNIYNLVIAVTVSTKILSINFSELSIAKSTNLKYSFNYCIAQIFDGGKL